MVKTALNRSRNITDVFDYVINDTFKSRNVNSNDVISNHTSNITRFLPAADVVIEYGD